MTDKTWDIEDPRELPYRFVYSPNTDEVFVLSLMRGIGIPMFFENKEAFHRFLAEGIKTKELIAERVLWDADNILKTKQGEQGD